MRRWNAAGGAHGAPLIITLLDALGQPTGETFEIPHDPDGYHVDAVERQVQAYRDRKAEDARSALAAALQQAQTWEHLRAALLGENISAQVAARPK